MRLKYIKLELKTWWHNQSCPQPVFRLRQIKEEWHFVCQFCGYVAGLEESESFISDRIEEKI